MRKVWFTTDPRLTASGGNAVWLSSQDYTDIFIDNNREEWYRTYGIGDKPPWTSGWRQTKKSSTNNQPAHRVKVGAPSPPPPSYKKTRIGPQPGGIYPSNINPCILSTIVIRVVIDQYMWDHSLPVPPATIGRTFFLQDSDSWPFFPNGGIILSPGTYYVNCTPQHAVDDLIELRISIGGDGFATFATTHVIGRTC